MIWFFRFTFWAESRFRPYRGWPAFSILILLSMLPAASFRINHWVRLADDQLALEIIGPLSVITVWLAAGWRQPRRTGKRTWIGAALMAAAVIAIGVLVISQLTIGWIPGPIEIGASVLDRTPTVLAASAADEWSRFGNRVQFWWEGVATGTAIQDNLLFLALAGIIVWVIGSVSAALLRRYPSGLLAAAPLLWLLGAILLYSSEGKILFIFALALAVVLHFFVDHEEMLAKWRKTGIDFSPGIFVDRLVLVLGAILLILTIAAVTPNLYVQALVDRYYAEMKPTYEAMEDAAKRLFPGVSGTSRLGGGGLSGGLPNAFLLQAGPELTDAVVMHVRTDDPIPSDYPNETVPPESHYMRGGTLNLYDGHGWRNSQHNAKQDVSANSQLPVDGSIGRREVAQQVALAFNTQIVYSAAEPLELSMDARLEYRTPGDMVVLWSKEKSYTVVSLVPAVDDETLITAGTWSDLTPLPEPYEVHLELPETVPQRTIDLAHSLVSDQPSLYESALAIEAYLRTYEYDLNVAGPPDNIVDVADYFLFDLQRGYCDYYATAFVVLARAAGIPTRFATGFVPGTWNPDEGRWTITEAEAHSWPEVFFPEYGWIPFEPTAGRPELARFGLPRTAATINAQPSGGPEPESVNAVDWNWQMLVWLAPIGLLLWGAWKVIDRLRRRNEDPWLLLQHWGSRVGRPMNEGETVLEYGHGLADYVLTSQRQRQDLARVAASEMRSMSEAVSSGNYAPEEQRQDAQAQVDRHWRTLRGYLSPLRWSR